MNRPTSLHCARLRRSLGAALAIGALSASATGCGGEATGPVKSARASGLPAWQGTYKELFGDEVDPSAMGIIPAKNPRKDKTLWVRAQASEVVGRVRVQTVTVDTRGADATYHLMLRFAEPPLAAPKLAERDFEVTIDPSDPAFGLVKAVDTGLQGKTFVGFVKRFAGVDDEVEVHFYLAPDSADVAAAVQEAVAVSEVSKQ